MPEIPPTHVEELLSLTYVMAVSATAGFSFNPEFRDYGVDGTLREIVRLPSGKYEAQGWTIDCQLKATVRWDNQGGKVRYQMEADAYNRIVRANQENITPRILILLCLPSQQADWLNLTEEQLVLRRCCYWDYISGDLTENAHSKTIYIPSANLLTPAALEAILDRIKRGETPNGNDN